MQEYAQKPEQSSSENNSRSSGQPPISEILQAYKNGTLQRMSVDEEELLQAKTRDKSSERETLQLYTDYTHRDKSRYNSFIQGMFDTPQRKGVGNEEPLQGKFDSSSVASESTIQREVKPNNTGLPDNLKSGIENLSGYSLDDVKVHYNSDKPAQLSALAYAQGTDIHVAPGQERHLPHEAWHVVQQKQGRVQPTMQMQGVDVNDNEGLEKEADVMGGDALQIISPLLTQVKQQHNVNLNVQRFVVTSEKVDEIDSVIAQNIVLQQKNTNQDFENGGHSAVYSNSPTIQRRLDFLHNEELSEKTELYHGAKAEDIPGLSVSINFEQGGGQLGKGFYTAKKRLDASLYAN